MKIDVLGLGESLTGYTNTGNATIGVNDIYKHYHVDYLCIVDLPDAFSGDRLKTILESKPKKFFTHLPEWRPLVSNYQEIKLSPGRGLLENLDTKDLVCYSNNSTYVACVLAFKLGGKELYLYGCDFNTHKNFQHHGLEIAMDHFKNLYHALLLRGVKMYVTKESRLSEFIPTIK